MSREAAFLSAIALAPADDLPRLAFADWLDEQNDPRGEFVRTGVAFDRTPPHDPARYQLADRLRHLLASPALADWLPDDPAFKWVNRRGFLTLRADTSKCYPDPSLPLATWFRSNWIERVEFDRSRSGWPESEELIDLFPNARELHFERDDYGPVLLQRLRVWPHLRSLRLSYRHGPWEEFAELPHLRELILDNPDWTVMPKLHEARLPQLELLHIDKEWEDDLPEWGTGFPNLRSLTLAQYRCFPDSQCGRFADCPHLRHLALRECAPITQVGLGELVRATELRSLTLGVWPEGSVERLAELPHLTHLGGDGLAEPIHGLESLGGLRWLSLTACRLTPALVSQVCALPNLSRLDLSCEQIVEGAVAALAAAPALRVLKVNVPWRAERPAVAELARLEALRTLLLLESEFPPQELNTLRTALPNCQLVVRRWSDAKERFDW